MIKDIKVIGFDADDTLWQNENIFREVEEKFYILLKNYGDREILRAQLFDVEMKNLPLYGYGVKAFTLSMIETALRVSKNKVAGATVKQLISIGRSMLREPILLIDGVDRTLKELSKKYKIIVATKGDLLDQERKLSKSGIAKYLHHIEIMSEKNPKGYIKLVDHLGIKAEEFLMVGNSLKSDILPVLEINAKAVHVPFFITWEHEKTNGEKIISDNFYSIKKIEDVLKLL